MSKNTTVIVGDSMISCIDEYCFSNTGRNVVACVCISNLIMKAVDAATWCT